jgi:thymidine kinase
LIYHDNQFGFVKNEGYPKAVFTFRSCVNYFTERGSNVHCVMLDSVKAFDRVNQYYLLSCLLERGVPIKVVQMLYSWYGNLFAFVSYSGFF